MPTAAIPNLRHAEYFHDHDPIERLLFEGALDPIDGVLRPNLHSTGHGLALRTVEANRFRAA